MGHFSFEVGSSFGVAKTVIRANVTLLWLGTTHNPQMEEGEPVASVLADGMAMPAPVTKTNVVDCF